MVPMKKAVIFSLAVLALSTQAYAVGERDSRTPEQRQAEIDRAAKDAANHGAVVSRDAVQATSRALSQTDLIRLSPTQNHNLQELMASDASILSMVKESLVPSNVNEVRSLNAAQLEGLSNLKGLDRSQTAQTISALDPSARAEQSYYTLVTSVARAARSWKGQSQSVATQLLVKANAHIAQGRSRGDALLLAKSEVEQDINSRKAQGVADYKINLDDIFKFCKTI